MVGILILDLFIGEANSLKEKRRVLRSIIDKVKVRFNVSITEVDKQDAWKFSTIAIAFISNENAHVEKTLSTVVKFIENMKTIEITNIQKELV